MDLRKIHIRDKGREMDVKMVDGCLTVYGLQQVVNFGAVRENLVVVVLSFDNDRRSLGLRDRRSLGIRPALGNSYKHILIRLGLCHAKGLLPTKDTLSRRLKLRPALGLPSTK